MQVDLQWASDRKQMGDCLGMERTGSREGEIPKGFEDTLGSDNTFIIMMVVIVPWR